MVNSGDDARTTENTITTGNTVVTLTPSQQIDSYHPYFLSTSDNPGMILLNVTFDGTCYGNWRRGVLISLSAKNKLGFINGSCPCPTVDSPLLEQWKRCNDMVIAWLLNSLSRDISESVISSQTAKELWTELEERYGQADGTKLFQQLDVNNAFLHGDLDEEVYMRFPPA